MVTCPPAAIRAHDLLTLESMAPFHPVLVAHLLQGADAAGLVSSVIRDLKYPVTVGLDSPEAAAVVAWHAAAELDACAAFLQGACARRLEDMLPTPEWDGSSTMYCPRCLCQLTTSADTCPDCPGVELRRLPTQQTTEVRLG